MKAIKSLALLLSTGLVFSHTALAFDINKDLKNLGPDAHDLAVILSGSETVTSTFNGYPSGQFQNLSHGPMGTNTMLHWKNFSDGADNKINTGQVIHVGWSTSDHTSTIFDMYWTDASGNRIPGSVLYNITSGWTYRTGRCVLHWRNTMTQRAAIRVDQIRFAVLQEALPLSALNASNRSLMQQLRPMPNLQTVALSPGRARELIIPAELSEDALRRGVPIVAVYQVQGPRSVATDFVQFICRTTPQND